MDKRTETALRASIAHWEDVVRDPLSTEIGPKACALCAVYNDPPGSGCDGCPVYMESGGTFCIGTPYEEYAREIDAFEDGDDEPELRRLATLELEFLKSLLP